MTVVLMVAMAAGAALAVSPVVLVAALRRTASTKQGGVTQGSATHHVGGEYGEPEEQEPTVRVPSPRTRRFARWVRAAGGAARRPDADGRQHRIRVAGWVSAGVVAWVATRWPAAGIAVTAVGVWTPWLLGSSRVIHERLDRLEALERWCRRMADVLAGGGMVGLTQAIITSSGHTDQRIAVAVATLGARLRDGVAPREAMREFADAVDERGGDTVAAALWLALEQQSSGVGQVLRQLADGLARDVRERRQIEAERGEQRQSIRMLLLIQAAVLVMLAVVPSFADAYRSPVGQVVMTVLLAATVALLIWMRRLALGQPAPRFLTGTGTEPARGNNGQRDGWHSGQMAGSRNEVAR